MSYQLENIKEAIKRKKQEITWLIKLKVMLEEGEEELLEEINNWCLKKKIKKGSHINESDFYFDYKGNSLIENLYQIAEKHGIKIIDENSVKRRHDYSYNSLIEYATERRYNIMISMVFDVIRLYTEGDKNENRI